MNAPVVAIGGSAGAIEALQELLPLIRAEWKIAFAIVLHRQAVEVDERLEKLLNRWSAIPVTKARDGEAIVGGRAVVAPADVHLAIGDSRYHLTTGPKENRSRPSLDVTFRSIAANAGTSGGAVVLSGMLDDGAAGIRSVRQHGGLTIAQDPVEAIHSSMPQSALDAGAEHTSTLAQMPRLLEAFANSPRAGINARATATHEALTRLTCPDCGGVLALADEDGYRLFRCRTGHAFSPETLDAEKGRAIEDALWTAIQVLEEQIDLTERTLRRARNRGDEPLVRQMQSRAKRLHERAGTVRRALPTIADAMADSDARTGIR